MAFCRVRAKIIIFADKNKSMMDLHFTVIVIAVSTFLLIGVFHPIVIKTEYYTGTRYWWVFMVLGMASICGALVMEDVLYSSLLGVLGASSLWTIGELYEQKKRVQKGWFPMNPKRKHEYKAKDTDKESSF